MRCWVAGWIWVLVEIALKLPHPSSATGRFIAVSLGLDALALAAISFLVSTMIVHEGRRAGLRLGILLAAVTLPCLTIAMAHPRSGWLLTLLVVFRQAVAVRLAMRPRPNRWPILAVVIPVCAASLVFMLYGIARGYSVIVVLALLGEMFIAAGVNLWLNGREHSLGLKTTCTGLIALGALFPLTALIGHQLADSTVASRLYGVAMFCAAIGMILIVQEEDARASRQLTEEYRLTFDTNPHPLWIYDAETFDFLDVNQAACDSHGYTRDELMNLRLPDIVEASEMPKVRQQLALTAPISKRASHHIHKDGRVLHMDITAYSTVFRGQPARFVLGIDVSEREELQRLVLHHARHDSLTGLPNRVLFEEQLQAAVTRAADAHEKLAILCLNLDRFKRINNTYGAAIGDQCLKQVSQILRAHVGPMDLLARTEGDGFALVLSGLRSGFQAENLLLELREKLREPFVAGDTKIRLSFSAGLALFPDDGIAPASLWRSAEGALSRARQAGVGQVAWSSSDLHAAAEQQVELEAFMRAQLEEGGFRLAYQPIFATDGEVESLEALLRLSHPVHGPISPILMIPLAEETGLIIPIGDWVIAEACRQLRAWRDAGVRPVPIAINISAMQLVQSGFAERVVATLARYQIAPEQLQLEVTESTQMLNAAEVIRQMTMLSEIGIRFSIDDFGTGHSTLNRLDKLPLHRLKIDKTFIERLRNVDGTRSIVQAMIWMAKALNMQVVAEGVEREEEIVALRQMGCDYLQGFLLSRPVSPADIPAMLEHNHPLLVNVGGMAPSGVLKGPYGRTAAIASREMRR